MRAYEFAAYAHHDQKVPGTDLPYVVHVGLVSIEIIAALNVEKGYNEDFVIQCALLHDIIEDTVITYDQLKEGFGDAVADGVLALTKDKTIARQLQMRDSLCRIKQQPREVWMVKLADRITNLQPPPSGWPKEKRIRYQEEAVEIYNALKDASDVLSARMLDKLETYKGYIE